MKFDYGLDFDKIDCRERHESPGVRTAGEGGARLRCEGRVGMG